jgi:hypothetical protein
MVAIPTYLATMARADTTGDPIRVEDLFLAADLEVMGCGAVADEIRDATSHDRVGWIRLLCSELLTRAAEGPGALATLLQLVELDPDEVEREEEARLERARCAGNEARAAGLVPAEAGALLDELRAIGSPLAETLEVCTCREDLDKVKALIALWHGDQWKLA